MKMLRTIFWVLGLAIVFVSCKKQIDTITISGKMVDSNQGIEIEGVRVELWAQKIESGIYSAHYDNYGIQITDAKGDFSFNLENRIFASVKLTFYKSNYYNWDFEIDGDVLKNNNLYNETYQMMPKAWIQISVKNVNPIDFKDYFDFRIMNGFTNCEFCCSGETMQFQGMDVDEDIVCQMIGHQDVNIRWNSSKGADRYGNIKLVFLPSFDTTRVEFNY